MQAKSCLSLENYVVKTMKFSINENFDFGTDATITLNPEFTRNINKIDDDTVLVNLIFCIDNKNADMPFDMEVNIEGIFRLENWEQPEMLPLIRSNSVAILFPYLRSVVTMITANANISPYVLPVMNIAAMFDQSTGLKSNN